MSSTVLAGAFRGGRNGPSRQQHHHRSVLCCVPVALDVAAIRSLVSILTGWIGAFPGDENFCSSLRRLVAESLAATNKCVAATLFLEEMKESIQDVEKQLLEKDRLDMNALLKATLRLEAATAMADTSSGRTPCSEILACAHLYLSICQVQMNSTAPVTSALHVLQVFHFSPHRARTKLLSELWDRLFLPNLSRIKLLYSEEQAPAPESVAGQDITELELMNQVYNDILDKCTLHYAGYYRYWLVGSSLSSPPRSRGAEGTARKKLERRSFHWLSGKLAADQISGEIVCEKWSINKCTGMPTVMGQKCSSKTKSPPHGGENVAILQSIARSIFEQPVSGKKFAQSKKIYHHVV